MCFVLCVITHVLIQYILVFSSFHSVTQPSLHSSQRPSYL